MKLPNLGHLRITFWVCAIFLLATAGLQATPVPPQACNLTGTVAQLEALGSKGCIIGDKLFTNFVYGSSGHGTSGGDAFVPTDANTAYTVINAGSALTPNLGPIGFDFDFTNNGKNANGMFANGTAKNTNSNADVSITFDVQVYNSPFFLTGQQICFGPNSPPPTGTATYPAIPQCATPTAGTSSVSAAATITEQNIANGMTAYNMGVASISGVNSYSDSRLISPGLPAGEILAVSKDINVTAIYPTGGPSQTAFIKSFADTFTQSTTSVPEPGFYGLLGAGLGGVFLIVKRRQKSIKS